MIREAEEWESKTAKTFTTTDDDKEHNPLGRFSHLTRGITLPTYAAFSAHLDRD